MNSINVRIFTLCVSVMFLNCSFVQADLVIGDSDFVDADWNVAMVFQQSASQQSQQIATGGNPDEFRQTTHTLNPDIAHERLIIAYHGFSSMAYDLSSQGAITSIDYFVNQIVINPPFAGAAITHRVALLQNGVIFTTISSQLSFTNTTWAAASKTSRPANGATSSAGRRCA